MILGLDACYCITLDRRPDRQKKFTDHMTEKGFNLPRRWTGVDGAKRFSSGIPAKFRGWEGALGCTYSHWEIAKHVLAKDWNAVLVMEDDCRFNCGPQEVQAFVDRSIRYNPIQIHLGREGSWASIHREIHGEGLTSVHSILNTHCYVMTRELALRINFALSAHPLRSDLTIQIDRLITSITAGELIICPATELAYQDKTVSTDVKWSCPDENNEAKYKS